MMKTLCTRPIRWLSLCGLASLTACASPLAQWDAQQGTSVRALRSAQVLDPQASMRNGDKQGTMDAKAALESADRYINSYKEPPVQNIFVVGTTSTGGGK